MYQGLLKGLHGHTLLSSTVFLVVNRHWISPFRVQLRRDPTLSVRLRGRKQGGAIDQPLPFLET